MLLTEQGFLVEIADSIPSSLNDYEQIWDVRYDTAIDDNQVNKNLSYLQSAGELFLIGENSRSFFTQRNNSVINLIRTVGGDDQLEIDYINYPISFITQTINDLYISTEYLLPIGTLLMMPRVELTVQEVVILSL